MKTSREQLIEQRDERIKNEIQAYERWPKYLWLVHNLIAHPLMAILALFGLYKLAFLIHDKTLPKPIDVKVKK